MFIKHTCLESKNVLPTPESPTMTTNEIYTGRNDTLENMIKF